MRLRPGTTLIELLLFLAILAAVGIAMFPILFAATEDRLLQQTVANVESNGVQLLETIGSQVHAAERIIGPSLHASGSILTLQTGSGGTNPTIVGLNNGSIVLIRGIDRQTISSSQVAVDSFSVQNTSTSAARGSVLVRFTLSRSIRLQAPRRYTQSFEEAFALPPSDEPKGAACNCAQPGCGNSSTYVWQVCIAGGCQTAQTDMQCP